MYLWVHVPKCLVENATPLLISTVVELFNKLLFGAAESFQNWLSARGIFLRKGGDTYYLSNYRSITNN